MARRWPRWLQTFWRYISLAYLRWWWAIYFAAIGVYELAGHLLPKSSSGDSILPELTTRAYWVLALIVLFAAPIPVYFGQRKREDDLVNRVERLERRVVQLLHDFSADLEFGDLSSLAPASRMQTGLDRLSEIEEQVRSGDYRNAGLVVPLYRVLLPLCAKYYGSAGGFFAALQERIWILFRLFVEHDLAEIESIPRPLLPERNPETGLSTWPQLPEFVGSKKKEDG